LPASFPAKTIYHIIVYHTVLQMQSQTVKWTASTASLRAWTIAGFFSRNFSSKTSTLYKHNRIHA